MPLDGSYLCSSVGSDLPWWTDSRRANDGGLGLNPFRVRQETMASKIMTTGVAGGCPVLCLSLPEQPGKKRDASRRDCCGLAEVWIDYTSASSVLSVCMTDDELGVKLSHSTVQTASHYGNHAFPVLSVNLP